MNNPQVKVNHSRLKKQQFEFKQQFEIGIRNGNKWKLGSNKGGKPGKREGRKERRNYLGVWKALYLPTVTVCNVLQNMTNAICTR